MMNLLEYLNIHKLISKCQHGFLQKHSCVTNLLESCRDWSISLAAHTSVVVANIDFQRAFDTVSHTKLLHKLSGYGIHGNLFHWISSFLSDRLQRVKVGSSVSKYCSVCSGIPQGSVIGPLLFNLFINDITDNLNPSVTVKLFADDVTMYSNICHENSCSDFQSSLNLIKQWSHDWQLIISVVKSNIIIMGSNIDADFFLDDTKPLTCVDSLKSLGVTLNSLTFSDHINDIVTRAKRSASLIFRCFNSHHVPSLTNAFKIYVRPMVEYATPVWSPYTVQSITQVEDVQRAFTRRLPGLSGLSYAERLNILGLQTLEHRRLLADILMCYKIIHGHIALNFDDFFSFSSNPTRGHPFKLIVPVAKCNRSKYAFASRVVPVWNLLPVSVVECRTVNAFKRCLREVDLSKFLIVSYTNNC